VVIRAHCRSGQKRPWRAMAATIDMQVQTFLQ
jgi:hypothetical protein